MGKSAVDTETLIVKMRELEWQKVCEVSPQWAQAYLDRFRALSGRSVILDSQVLERTLAPHVEALRSQGNFPNFFYLRAQALRELAKRSEPGK